MAGYSSGDAGVDTLRTVSDKVVQGRSLLIFPEGTRTEVGLPLGTLKAGYALIASRARAPVQLVIIRSTPGLVARGRPWWKYPKELPSFVSVTLDRRWEYDPGRHASELTDQLQKRILEVL
jgi:1-acyl-sn-glycerol-3-phosphate acyltransferase